MGTLKLVLLSGIVFLFLGFGFQKFLDYRGKFKAEVAKERLSIEIIQQVRKGDYDIIDVGTLKLWMDEGKQMKIIDTMPETHFDKMHIPQAIQFLFPIPEMEKWDNELTGGSLEEFAELLGDDKSIAVVIYCGFVECTRSHNAALWARNLGYEKVYRLPGGIFAWKGADYELE